jgi:hypothetical protein
VLGPRAARNIVPIRATNMVSISEIIGSTMQLWTRKEGGIHGKTGDWIRGHGTGFVVRGLDS